MGLGGTAAPWAGREEGGSWGGKVQLQQDGSCSPNIPTPLPFLPEHTQGWEQGNSRASLALAPGHQGGAAAAALPHLSPAGGPGQAEGFEGWDKALELISKQLNSPGTRILLPCPALPVWGERGSGVEAARLPWCRDPGH